MNWKVILMNGRLFLWIFTLTIPVYNLWLNTTLLKTNLLDCLECAIPKWDMFRFQTFEEIKDAFVKNSKAKYAHWIVAKHLEVLCPSFILCGIRTDSKYDNNDISSRWIYIAEQLKEIGVTVVCNGADAKHNLTQCCIDNKDKQNYSSIPVLIVDRVKDCLDELNENSQNTGTLVYLQIMRQIITSIFDKSISPFDRIVMIWRVVFFCRICRKRLSLNGYSEKEHFLTSNAYLCIEINVHTMLSLLINQGGISGAARYVVAYLWKY